MKNALSRIEARLQTLIEGSAAKIFPSRRRPDHLAARLIESMHSGAAGNPSGSASGATLAPNLYTIEMNPVQVGLLKDNPDLIESLAQSLREAGAEAGFEFPSPPVVRVAASADVPTGELRVQARNSHHGLAATSDLPVELDGEPGYLPPNAFLIVDGTRIYPLEEPVVNIGRRPDNQLVIEDARVSRVHAQLRVVRHRYVIFDLDSSGGTFVNGESISQQPLYPGDVISLAGVPLVYGQDSTAPNDTQTIQPGASPPHVD